MDEETQLLTTGHVIAAARKIETRLAECGGSGSGLREKIESLRGRLQPETVSLINHIGGVRNRFAHESGADLRPDELELFDEAVNAVLEDLDELAAQDPAKTAEKRTSVSPVQAVPPLKEPEKQLPPWSSPLWAALPGPHLLYAVLIGWNAFGPGQLYLLLLLTELIALTALSFAIALASLPLAIAGGCLFGAVWLCGLLLGLRCRSAEEGIGFSPIPLLNLLWFLQKIAAYADPARLIAAGAILGIWLAAIQLAISGEYVVAIFIAVLSWGSALVDVLFHRP